MEQNFKKPVEINGNKHAAMLLVKIAIKIGVFPSKTKETKNITIEEYII